jgi:hypothetical protein
MINKALLVRVGFAVSGLVALVALTGAGRRF